MAAEYWLLVFALGIPAVLLIWKARADGVAREKRMRIAFLNEGLYLTNSGRSFLPEGEGRINGRAVRVAYIERLPPTGMVGVVINDFDEASFLSVSTTLHFGNYASFVATNRRARHQGADSQNWSIVTSNVEFEKSSWPMIQRILDASGEFSSVRVCFELTGVTLLYLEETGVDVLSFSNARMNRMRAAIKVSSEVASHLECVVRSKAVHDG